MIVHLNRRYRFSASHRLHNPEMTAEENWECYGKCNNPHGHGHNYTVEVTVKGEVDAVTGMVCNLGDLDGFMQREIVERFDESNLNEDEWFRRHIPTTEALCKSIFHHVAEGFTLAELERVRVEETSHNAFEYSLGTPAPPRAVPAKRETGFPTMPASQNTDSNPAQLGSSFVTNKQAQEYADQLLQEMRLSIRQSARAKQSQ